MADRIVSLGRVYPGNRDWRRDLERGGVSEAARRSQRSDEPGNDEAISSVGTSVCHSFDYYTEIMGCISNDINISVKNEAKFIAV